MGLKNKVKTVSIDKEVKSNKRSKNSLIGELAQMEHNSIIPLMDLWEELKNNNFTNPSIERKIGKEWDYDSIGEEQQEIILSEFFRQVKKTHSFFYNKTLTLGFSEQLHNESYGFVWLKGEQVNLLRIDNKEE